MEFLTTYILKQEGIILGLEMARVEQPRVSVRRSVQWVHLLAIRTAIYSIVFYILLSLLDTKVSHDTSVFLPFNSEYQMPPVAPR